MRENVWSHSSAGRNVLVVRLVSSRPRISTLFRCASRCARSETRWAGANQVSTVQSSRYDKLDWEFGDEKCIHANYSRKDWFHRCGIGRRFYIGLQGRWIVQQDIIQPEPTRDASTLKVTCSRMDLAALTRLGNYSHVCLGKQDGRERKNPSKEWVNRCNCLCRRWKWCN